MKDPQEIFEKIQRNKLEVKELRDIYRELLSHSIEFQDLQEEMRILKQKKREIEINLLETDFEKESFKLDELNLDTKELKEMLNDIVITKMMKGESVEITDDYDRIYEPTYKVEFKKTN